MKAFLDNSFLLHNPIAEELYHEYASKQPIIDHHNHLPPNEVAANKQFDNVTPAWLNVDHYKLRALPTTAINAKYISGAASAEEKVEKWAETVPYTLRNPPYHWTHLEMQRYFDVN